MMSDNRLFTLSSYKLCYVGMCKLFRFGKAVGLSR